MAWLAWLAPPPAMAAPLGVGQPSGVGAKCSGANLPEPSDAPVNTPRLQGVELSHWNLRPLSLRTSPSATCS